MNLFSFSVFVPIFLLLLSSCNSDFTVSPVFRLFVVVSGLMACGFGDGFFLYRLLLDMVLLFSIVYFHFFSCYKVLHSIYFFLLS